MARASSSGEGIPQEPDHETFVQGASVDRLVLEPSHASLGFDQFEILGVREALTAIDAEGWAVQPRPEHQHDVDCIHIRHPDGDEEPEYLVEARYHKGEFVGYSVYRYGSSGAREALTERVTLHSAVRTVEEELDPDE